MAARRNFDFEVKRVSAGPTDLAALGHLRPETAKSYSEMIPDYANDPTGTLSERSAIAWPEKNNTPHLLLHGTLGVCLPRRR